MAVCAAHLRAWVAHVPLGTEGVAIALIHIERIENEL